MTDAPAALPGGVVPPLCTPLSGDDEVDVASVRRLVEHVLAAGVAGVFVAGSTGEAAYLPDRLRADMLAATVDAVAGRVPVWCGVIDTSTRRMLEHARVAQRLGASALVATVPFYSPTSPAEWPGHFAALHDAVDLPVLAYNIPAAVHSELRPETTAALAEAGLIDGIKDSSGNLDVLRSTLDLMQGKGFRVYTGSESLTDLALVLGADGLVPGLGNVDPAGYVRICEAVRRGDLPAARAEQDRIRTLQGIVDVPDRGRMGPYSAAIGAFKEAAHQLGAIATARTNPPMVPLDDGEKRGIARILAATGLSPDQPAETTAQSAS
ncbi:MAG: dihydrodipicolinate synthase family protein [Mycobacteriales bacterium]